MGQDDLAWLLWVEGTRGPEPQLLTNRWDLKLTDVEKKRRLGEPIPVPDDERGFPLAALAKLHPPTGSAAAGAAERAKKLLALAEDPGATEGERAAARAKLDQMGARG